MDYAASNHFLRWLAQSVSPEDRERAFEAVTAYLRDADPEAIERGLTWREMWERMEAQHA